VRFLFPYFLSGIPLAREMSVKSLTVSSDLDAIEEDLNQLIQRSMFIQIDAPDLDVYIYVYTSD